MRFKIHPRGITEQSTDPNTGDRTFDSTDNERVIIENFGNNSETLPGRRGIRRSATGCGRNAVTLIASMFEKNIYYFLQ